MITSKMTHKNPHGYLVSPIVTLKISRNQLPSASPVGQAIPNAFAQMDPNPLVIIQVHRVAKNGGRFIMDTRTPFNVPIATPNKIATSMPAHVGHPQWTIR